MRRESRATAACGGRGEAVTTSTEVVDDEAAQEFGKTVNVKAAAAVDGDDAYGAKVGAVRTSTEAVDDVGERRLQRGIRC